LGDRVQTSHSSSILIEFSGRQPLSDSVDTAYSGHSLVLR
jgi:hypothetical protein